MSLAKEAAEQMTGTLDYFAQGSSNRAETGFGTPSNQGAQIAMDEPFLLSALRSKEQDPTGVTQMYRDLLFGKARQPKPQSLIQRGMGQSIFGFRREGAMNAIGDVGHARFS